MPLSPIDTPLAAMVPWLLAWGPPLAYIALSVVTNRVRAAREARVPSDMGPTPDTPDLHPVLLGALRCRDDGASSDAESACGIALAAVARLVGLGGASFEDRVGTAGRAPEPDENEGPIATGARRRRARDPLHPERLVHEYGASLWLTVSAPEPGRCDREALRLIMPPGSESASVEDLCRHVSSTDSYKALRGFLERFDGDLFAAGLARRVSVPTRLVFNPLVSLLMCAWCVLGPACAVPDVGSSLAPVAVALLLAVILSRALFVNLGPQLTSEGARALCRAQANVLWAEAAVDDKGALIDGLSDAQVADLLGVLLAMGRADVAASLAERLLARAESGRWPPAALQEAEFCARRPYVWREWLHRALSPVELLLDRVRDLDRRMS